MELTCVIGSAPAFLIMIIVSWYLTTLEIIKTLSKKRNLRQN